MVQIVEALEPDSKQLPLKLPVPFVESVKLPEGATTKLAPEVSVTVTVQDEEVVTVTGVAQLRLVRVVRRFTMIVKAIAVALPPWALSPLSGA
jgi:hypothetical protein